LVALVGVVVRFLVQGFLFLILPCWAWAAPEDRVVSNELKPVAFVLASTEGIEVTNLHQRTYAVLPLQRFVEGHVLTLPKKARLSLLLLETGQRRVYNGPAKLEVGGDVVFVRSGKKPKVSQLDEDQRELVEQWMVEYPRRGNKPEKRVNTNLEVRFPEDGEMLLSRMPEFVFKGTLPRDANLLLFDANDKRIWVQPFDNLQFSFPTALGLEWGQRVNWEVRKPTGGRLLAGSFHIASEETARALLDARIPENPKIKPEFLLFYGMRLQLAGAYQEARTVWEDLGFQVDRAGRPSKLE
jgi:hypothetical protein